MIVQEDKHGIHALGYVNVVDRYSTPINDLVHKEQYVERVNRGVFRDTLGKGVPNGVYLDLNHDNIRRGTQKDKTIQTLIEDEIGLYAKVYTEDEDLVEKGLNGDLVGWSYAMKNFDGEYYVLPTDEVEKFADVSGVLDPKMGVHNVHSMDLTAISLIDRTLQPTSKTSLYIRAHDGVYCGGTLISEPHIIRRPPQKYICFDKKYGHLLDAK